MFGYLIRINFSYTNFCDVAYEKHTDLKERRLRQMIHTALSATHMVDISLRDPGGGEMIKVRLQGTKEDMEWLEKQLSECPEVKITESSETFSNKGTSKYYRKYLEINRKNEE